MVNFSDNVYIFNRETLSGKPEYGNKGCECWRASSYYLFDVDFKALIIEVCMTPFGDSIIVRVPLVNKLGECNLPAQD